MRDDATVGKMSSDTTATGSKSGNAMEDELRASVSDVRFRVRLDDVGGRIDWGTELWRRHRPCRNRTRARRWRWTWTTRCVRPLPREIRVQECEAQVSVTELTFTEGSLRAVLNMAISAIRLELGRTLGALTCSSMTSGLKKFSGTDPGQRWEDGQLARLERVMQNAFEEAPPIPFPTHNPSAGVA